MPPALRASGIGDHFRKCSSRRLSRPARRGRFSVTTMGIGAGAAFPAVLAVFPALQVLRAEVPPLPVRQAFPEP